jgi:5-formyltetrahydrofolate cyclo-ligase
MEPTSKRPHDNNSDEEFEQCRTQQKKEPHHAISLMVHPNPESPLEEVVTQSLKYSGKMDLPVWFQLGPVRCVIREPYKTVNEYTQSIRDAFAVVQQREEQASRPRILTGEHEPQKIITEIAPNSPFGKTGTIN